MPENDDNRPFDDMDSNGEDDNFNAEAKELRRRIEEIHKKLTGENTNPITNDDILQFVRIINFNFVSLTKLLHTILLKIMDIDTTVITLGLNSARMNKQLQQFFETNSMLDDIIKDDLNVSGSSSKDKFIL